MRWRFESTCVGLVLVLAACNATLPPTPEATNVQLSPSPPAPQVVTPSPTASPKASATASTTPTASLSPLPSWEDLLGTLPTTAGRVTFDGVSVVTDSLHVGVAEDDVLAALGKRRTDATIVFRSNSKPSHAYIGVVAVRDVRGDALLDAFAQNWSAGNIRRTRRSVNGTTGWELEERHTHKLTVFYSYGVSYPYGGVVYIASSTSRRRVEAMLKDMPRFGP